MADATRLAVGRLSADGLVTRLSFVAGDCCYVMWDLVLGTCSVPIR